MFHEGCDPKDWASLLDNAASKSSPESHKVAIAYNDVQGRYLVAREDIAEGDLILHELPLNQSPSLNTAPLCLGCYKLLQDPADFTTCKNCGWPLCKETCADGVPRDPQQRPYYHQPECQVFQRRNVKMDSSSASFTPGRHEPMYDIIAPLKVIWQKWCQPEGFRRFWKLMSHIDHWLHSDQDEGTTSSWKASHQYILDYLLKTLKLGEEDPEVDELFILTLFGIFYTNDFSTMVNWGDPGGGHGAASKIRLTYGLTSMFSHSCVVNTDRRILAAEDGFAIEVRASKSIMKGDQIFLNYVDTLMPTVARQHTLMESKKFRCLCQRCLDPTEMGTFGSSLICKACLVTGRIKKSSMGLGLSSGLLMPKMTEDGTVDSWTCNTCGNTEPDGTELTLKVCKEVEDLTQSLPNGTTIARLEAFLAQYDGKVLHPGHMAVTAAKYSLSALYGRLAGHEVNDLTPDMVQRKRQICEDVLAVMDKIDPSMNSRKGALMYELHLPLIMLAQLGMSKGNLSRKDGKRMFKRGLTTLKKCHEVCKKEPLGTFERAIYESSKDSVKYLEEFYSNL